MPVAKIIVCRLEPRGQVEFAVERINGVFDGLHLNAAHPCNIAVAVIGCQQPERQAFGRPKWRVRLAERDGILPCRAITISATEAPLNRVAG
jgi:hypothetical protein